MRKLAVLAMAVLCACATARKQQPDQKVVLYSSPGAPKPQGTVICAPERPTGSNIAQRVCRYENQSDWSAQRTQDMVRDMQRGPCASRGSCAGN